ncbi:hypothetical protein ABFE25_16895 [Bacillus toyonensis]|uniref:hypothetical protein n=1 Tax=Bacillus toyonensis TaxID=155322 RepID=UPI0032196D7D
MYVEQLRWLSAISCAKPIHLPPTHFSFLEEGVFLAKMIKTSKEIYAITGIVLIGLYGKLRELKENKKTIF